MQRLGMFGHSFGGATALQFCHDDPRCKAGIDIDGAPYGSVVQEGLKQPFMFILSDHSRELSDPANRHVLAHIQSIYDRLPNGRLQSPSGGEPTLVSATRCYSRVITLSRRCTVGNWLPFRTPRARHYCRGPTHVLRRLSEGRTPDLLNKPSQLYPEVQFVLQ